MKYYTIPLFIAILTMLGTIFFFILKVKKTRISNAYIVFLFNVIVWLATTFILHNIYLSSFSGILLRISSIVTFFLGFSILNFIYKFLRKKPDFIYKLFFFISLASVIFYNFTPYIIDFSKFNQVKDARAYVVSLFYFSKPYSPTILKFLFLIAIILPTVYAFWLVWKEKDKEIDIDRKIQYKIFLVGGIITLSIGCIITFLINRYFKVQTFIGLQFLTVISIVFFTFFTIKRSSFFVPSIESFSEELFDHAEDGIIILNNANRIVEANKVIRNWFDPDIKTLTGMKIDEVIKGYDFKKGTFIVKKGNRYFQIKKIPLSERKKLIGTAVIVIDITTQRELEEELIELNANLQEKVVERTVMLEKTVNELQDEMERRLKAEKELRDTVSLYQTLFESGSDAIILYDLEGRIIDVNEKACEMLGMEKSKLYDADIFEFIDFGKSREVILNIKNKTDMKKDFIIEGKLCSLEERCIEIEANIRYVVIGEREGYLMFIRDITQRKEMEKQLININRLNSIMTFAGGIAHDFNNMLTAIFGNLSLLKAKLKAENAICKRIEKIENTLNQAKALTQQLLSLSKGGEPIKEVSTIKELLIDTVTFALRGVPIEVIFKIPDDLPLIAFDKAQISRVIQNIIINAMEALADTRKPKIEIEAKEEDVPLEKRKYIEGERAIKIVIRDNGPGIPSKLIDHIFDPFFTTKQKGSGLGLAVAYSIIKKHGGHIEVESEPDRGTSFYIYLPISKIENIKKEKLPQGDISVPSVRYGKILVMDDEEMIRDFLYEALTMEGFEVELAKDGKEAVEKYLNAFMSSKPFDLVILDLTVPEGMGGEEAFSRIKKVNPHAKVIVSSGYSDTNVMSKYKEYGFVGCLHKPYTLPELFSLIDSILSERQRKI